MPTSGLCRNKAISRAKGAPRGDLITGSVVGVVSFEPREGKNQGSVKLVKGQTNVRVSQWLRNVITVTGPVWWVMVTNTWLFRAVAGMGRFGGIRRRCNFLTSLCQSDSTKGLLRPLSTSGQSLLAVPGMRWEWVPEVVQELGISKRKRNRVCGSFRPFSPSGGC